MDFLTKTIGSLTGSNTPFNVGERINGGPNDYPTIWSIYDGTVKVCLITYKHRVRF
jgi:hypothetical protein